ncbi:MAG: hypothetical protein FJ276_06540 [Planctomycetes bacterium]|nr:hypothetical protein [Planctomycetota bacterium]
MSVRVDRVDFPALCQMEKEHNWLAVRQQIGRGSVRVIRLAFNLPAYARGEDPNETPAIRPGPWPAKIMLHRGMAAQPSVQVERDEHGHVPISGSILDWRPLPGDRGELRVPGLVCWTNAWDPTRFTLGWVAYATALIITGNVLGFEAEPLNPHGRDWQLEALGRGWLPTAAVSRPRDELLYLGGVAPREPAAGRDDSGIEFHEG